MRWVPPPAPRVARRPGARLRGPIVPGLHGQQRTSEPQLLRVLARREEADGVPRDLMFGHARERAESYLCALPHLIVRAARCRRIPTPHAGRG